MTTIDRLIERWTKDAIAGGQLDVFDELLAEDVLDRSGPTETRGRESFKLRARAVRETFSDIVIIVDEVIADAHSEAIAWRWTLTGTLTLPARERVVLQGANFQRLADGRVTEHWTVAR